MTTKRKIFTSIIAAIVFYGACVVYIKPALIKGENNIQNRAEVPHAN